MNKYESKIELMNYLNVLWKRKWLIMIATFLLTSVTAVVSFILPPKWEVDAIFEPSKFIIQTEGGMPREKFFHTPKSIVDYANNGGYNNSVSTDLNLNINDLPKLRAENPTNTNLVQFSIEEKDVEKAKLILNSLLNLLKGYLDGIADFKREEINTQIKSKEIEKSIAEEEFNVSNNKLNIIKQKKQEIEKEMSNIRKRIEELGKERRLILNKKSRSESDNLLIFLYSTEIQQVSLNHTVLRGLLEDKNMEEEKINLEKKNEEIKINQIENEINDLNERKKNIFDARIIKEPTVSISPVSPNKLLNILIAAPLGFIIFTMVAYFLEYLEKYKVRSKGQKKI